MKDWPKILRDAPEAALTSEYKRRIAAKRKTFGAGYGGGRPRNPDRCACGKFTRATADKRGHRCTTLLRDSDTTKRKKGNQ